MFRIFKHYMPRSLVLPGLAEGLILFGSVYVGMMLGSVGSNPVEKLVVGALWTRALPYALIMFLLMSAMGLYVRGMREDLRGILFRLGAALLLGFMLISGVLALAPSMAIGEEALSAVFALSAAGLLLCRALAFRLGAHDPLKRRIVVVGTGQVASQIEKSLRRKVDWLDMMLVGYLEIPGEQRVVRESKVLAADPDRSLQEFVHNNRVDEIVVAVDDRRRSFPTEELLACKMRGIEVIDLMTFMEKATGKINLDQLKPSSILFADGFRRALFKGRLRRTFDLVLSISMLLATVPIMLFAATAILIESRGRGPVLYRQVRVGRFGRPFEILKFRSMRVDAECGGKAQWATANDPRVTTVGAVLRKTRIDELPQLINVVRGDMSFVGPRPERPEFVEELKRTIPFYDLRHSVNPGITGWAQIRYRYGSSETDAKEKLQYDLYYIKNSSIFLDTMIMLDTIEVTLWGKGAR